MIRKKDESIHKITWDKLRRKKRGQDHRSLVSGTSKVNEKFENPPFLVYSMELGKMYRNLYKSEAFADSLESDTH